MDVEHRLVAVRKYAPLAIYLLLRLSRCERNHLHGWFVKHAPVEMLSCATQLIQCTLLAAVVLLANHLHLLAIFLSASLVRRLLDKAIFCCGVDVLRKFAADVVQLSDHVRRLVAANALEVV